MEIRPNTLRYAVNDSLHYNQGLWNESTLSYIQETVAHQLYNHPQVKKRIIVNADRIKEVMDSISESNPRTGTEQVVEMIIGFITSYISNEYSVNQTPSYDSRVTLYDGTFGIQRMASGQLGIRKKGLNRIGRMF
jgi:hypothetical protein